MTKPKDQRIITEADLLQALWSAWYHGELDNLHEQHNSINGNDDPVLVEAARDIFNRIETEEV